MISRVWLRIFAIIALVTLPLLGIQYRLQRGSIETVYGLATRALPGDILENHLNLLKASAKREPEKEAQYRAEFDRALEARIAREDLETVREGLIRDLLRQSILAAVATLAVLFLLSFVVSRDLVGIFRRMLAENERAREKLERLKTIETWQRIAKTLVHELRAPVTPIKLVATDLPTKRQALPEKQFHEYAEQAMGLVSDRVAAIERMLDNFSRFAKMPEVRKARVDPGKSLEDFAQAYANYGNAQLKIARAPTREIPMDAAAIQQVLFNLLKNAVEANAPEPIQVTIELAQEAGRTRWRFRNSGKSIPPEAAERLFELSFSTKGGGNMGIGLTVSKKIALDHGGDLWLVSARSPVEFELEIPNE